MFNDIMMVENYLVKTNDFGNEINKFILIIVFISVHIEKLIIGCKFYNF